VQNVLVVHARRLHELQIEGHNEVSAGGDGAKELPSNHVHASDIHKSSAAVLVPSIWLANQVTQWLVTLIAYKLAKMIYFDAITMR
jgi:hypothetical protein